MLKDRDTLVKLLEQTKSPHQSEVLNAIRLANSLVEDSGDTWNDVINHTSLSESPEVELFEDIVIREIKDLLPHYPEDSYEERFLRDLTVRLAMGEGMSPKQHDFLQKLKLEQGR